VRAVAKPKVPGKSSLPAIYLSDLGPRRIVTRLKWLVSTLIVGFGGLVIIGIVIYTSMNMKEGGGIFGAMRQASLDAMKPQQAAPPPITEQPAELGRKTNRIVVSSKGLATRNLIYDQVVERRGTRDFIANKPYARLVVSLPTDRPRGADRVPPFNPLEMFGNDAPIVQKDQAGSETTTDPRVDVHFVEVQGGFLPVEDGQELSADEVEHLVAETDAVYSESEATLNDAEANSAQHAPPANQGPIVLAKQNTTILFKKSEEEDLEESYDAHSVIAKAGETIDALLKRQGVNAVLAGSLAEAMAAVNKSPKLQAGQELRLALGPSTTEEGGADLVKVTLLLKGRPEITLARNAAGDYEPSGSPVRLEAADEDGDGKQRASVYVSALLAGESQSLPDDFMLKALRIHAYDVDYKQKVRPGDGFELFYEVIQDESGNDKPGELLYAAITIAGETRGYYRFRTPDGSVDYYDDKGSNSKKFLMRMPLKVGRLTSSFGYRLHPLLGIKKLHTGVDWGAPKGSPIMASGSGTIELAGRRGGYGNYVRIRHANGYKTAYGHMARIAEGIAKGVKVQQGQIIGYVGATGMATGPHLHYEVLVNNRFMNPLSLKVPRSRQLQGRLLSEFRREKGRIDDLMHRAPVKTRVAAIEK
jgi:murein DD-endopeptidase MepM/ murein hydrolase activator NlpD